MDLLARLKQVRAADDGSHGEPSPNLDTACPRCGERFDRLVDPAGRWFVCTRCGHLTGTREET